MPDPTPRAVVTPGAAGQFVLEIAALIGFGRLGWHLVSGGVTGAALATLVVVAAGAVWGIFRTRGFVPNGSEPVIAIPGPMRLGLELVFFLIAAWGMWISGWSAASIIMLAGTVLVYWATRGRVRGLLANHPPTVWIHPRERLLLFRKPCDSYTTKGCIVRHVAETHAVP